MKRIILVSLLAFTLTFQPFITLALVPGDTVLAEENAQTIDEDVEIENESNDSEIESEYTEGESNSSASEENLNETNEQPETQIENDKDFLFTVEDIAGTYASSIESLYGSKARTSQSGSPILSNFTLDYKDGQLIFNGMLTYANESVELQSYGDAYKNEITLNSGVVSENLILGDMADTANYTVEQFRIDKDNAQILLILQEKNSKTLLEFQIPMDIAVFNAVYDFHENTIIEEELEEKIISLYSLNIGNKLPSVDSTVTVSPAVAMDETPIQARATYSGWKRLIDDLNSKGSVKLSNYSNIDKSFFTGYNWHTDVTWGSSPYIFKSATAISGTDMRISQITLYDVITQGYDGGASDKWMTKYQIEIYDGMVVQYYIPTDTLSVIYYGYCLDNFDFEIGMSVEKANSIYINRVVDGKYTKKGSLVLAALGLFDLTDGIYNFFDNLRSYENVTPLRIEIYDSTVAGQISRYGKPIRGIAVSAGEGHLNEVGHRLYVEGVVNYTRNNTFDITNWHRFSSSHVL